MQYDLTDLRLFLHIGETLNLTRAAERSFLSAPAASMRIKQIEEAFQTPLLLLHAKGVQLTAAGALLLDHARIVFRQLECMHSDLQPFASGIKARVKMLANSTATSNFLPDALSSFLAMHPDIDIELEEAPSRDIASDVVKGVADLGIVGGHVASQELEVLPLYRDELTLITAVGDDSLPPGPMQLAQLLNDSPFVGLKQSNSIQTFIDGIAHRAGKRLNLRIQVGSFEAVCRMVEAGAGVAVVPRICALRHGLDRLRLIPLDEPWALRDFSLIRQRQRVLPQSSEKLIAHLLQQAAELQAAHGGGASGVPSNA